MVQDWGPELDRRLAALCKELDRGDHDHCFAVDVVRTYPDLAAAYRRLCPQRTDLAQMSAKARDGGYTKARGVVRPSDAVEAFRHDVRLLHRNCCTFNRGNDLFVGRAEELLAAALPRLEALEAEFERNAAAATGPSPASTPRALPTPAAAAVPAPRDVRRLPVVPKRAREVARPQLQPRPHEVPLVVPPALRRFVAAEFEQSRAPSGAAPWALPAAVPASAVLDGFLAAVAAKTADGIEQCQARADRPGAVEAVLLADAEATYRAVVGKVLRPSFQAAACATLLYPHERPVVLRYAAVADRPVWLDVLPASVLLRWVLQAPQAAAAVLYSATGASTDAAVGRSVCPVVQDLLRFMAANRARIGLDA